mmetsp:Transcript_47692/g.144210  ORF Transcript_47692/g.144210 Transcript_47692/m.144210 type:complete len:266 (-) Transcript_47692:1455-2252(-)
MFPFVRGRGDQRGAAQGGPRGGGGTLGRMLRSLRPEPPGPTVGVPRLPAEVLLPPLPRGRTRGEVRYIHGSDHVRDGLPEGDGLFIPHPPDGNSEAGRRRRSAGAVGRPRRPVGRDRVRSGRRVRRVSAVDLGPGGEPRRVAFLLLSRLREAHVDAGADGGDVQVQPAVRGRPVPRESVRAGPRRRPPDRAQQEPRRGAQALSAEGGQDTDVGLVRDRGGRSGVLHGHSDAGSHDFSYGVRPAKENKGGGREDGCCRGGLGSTPP